MEKRKRKNWPAQFRKMLSVLRDKDHPHFVANKQVAAFLGVSESLTSRLKEGVGRDQTSLEKERFSGEDGKLWRWLVVFLSNRAWWRPEQQGERQSFLADFSTHTGRTYKSIVDDEPLAYARWYDVCEEPKRKVSEQEHAPHARTDSTESRKESCDASENSTVRRKSSPQRMELDAEFIDRVLTASFDKSTGLHSLRSMNHWLARVGVKLAGPGELLKNKMIKLHVSEHLFDLKGDNYGIRVDQRKTGDIPNVEGEILHVGRRWLVSRALTLYLLSSISPRFNMLVMRYAARKSQEYVQPELPLEDALPDKAETSMVPTESTPLVDMVLTKLTFIQEETERRFTALESKAKDQAEAFKAFKQALDGDRNGYWLSETSTTPYGVFTQEILKAALSRTFVDAGVNPTETFVDRVLKVGQRDVENCSKHRHNNGYAGMYKSDMQAAPLGVFFDAPYVRTRYDKGVEVEEEGSTNRRFYSPHVVVPVFEKLYGALLESPISGVYITQGYGNWAAETGLKGTAMSTDLVEFMEKMTNCVHRDAFIADFKRNCAEELERKDRSARGTAKIIHGETVLADKKVMWRRFNQDTIDLVNSPLQKVLDSE